MEYTIDYLPDKNIVDVKMKGRLNFQIAEQYSKEALKLAHKNDCTKFLFDHKETAMQVGVTNIHTTGDELQQFGFKNTDRIAIVVENLRSYSNLLEPKNQNSFWSVIKYFRSDNIQEAFDWLLGTELK